MSKKRLFNRVMAIFMAVIMLSMNINLIGTEAATTSPVTKVTVKATGTKLVEGQTLTKDMIKKVVTVAIERKNGKKSSNFTSYTCSQVGKVIKPITSGTNKGKFKLTIKAGQKSKSIYVKVNALTKLYASTTLKLKEGQKFSTSTFKNTTTVKAKYSSGSTKKITSYTVSVASTVTANSDGYFVVTVKYGTLSKKVNVPVEKKEIPKPEEYVVTVSAINADNTVKVSLNGKSSISAKFKAGENCKLQATSTTTCKFSKWVTSEGKEISTSATYSFPVNSSIAIFAVYEKVIQTPIVEKYTLSAVVNPSGSGSVSIGNVTSSLSVTKEVQKGTSVTIVATPSQGYEFLGWKDSTGSYISTNEVYSLTIYSDKIFFADFGKKEISDPSESNISITLKRSGDGIVAMNNSNITFSNNSYTTKVTKGSIVTLTATNTSSYKFMRWSDGTTSATKTFTANTAIEITAVFDKVYSISVEKAGSGKVAIDGEDMEFFQGKATQSMLTPGTYSLVATSSDGYRFDGWKDSTGRLTTSNTYNVTVANSNVTVKATFSEVDTTVTVSYKVDGESQPVLSQAVNKGETLTPPTNIYRTNKNFLGWELNGVRYEPETAGNFMASEYYNGTDKLSDAIKALTSTDSEVTVIAKYDDVPIVTYYTVTFSNGGSVNNYVDGTYLEDSGYTAGTHIYVTAPATSGTDVFSYWLYNGSKISYLDYDFVINQDTILSAVYEPVAADPEPTVSMTYSVSLDQVTGKIVLSMTSGCEIPDDPSLGYSNLEFGVLVSASTSTLSIENVDGSEVKKYTSGSTSLRQQDWIQNVLFPASWVGAGKTVYICVYDTYNSTVKSSGTIYGTVYTINLDSELQN